MRAQDGKASRRSRRVVRVLRIWEEKVEVARALRRRTSSGLVVREERVAICFREAGGLSSRRWARTS